MEVKMGRWERREEILIIHQMYVLNPFCVSWKQVNKQIYKLLAKRNMHCEEDIEKVKYDATHMWKLKKKTNKIEIDP